ncbi:MAG: carbohydrate ABC transporter permease [Dehalococcoidia bacterium]|jgi:putative aldouronate transport system permease protein
MGKEKAVVVKRVTVSKVIIYSILVALSILTLFPFWYVIVQSFSDPTTGSKAWIVPIDPFVMNYRVVFMTPGIGVAYLNTLYRVAAGVPLYLLVTGTTAFVFSRKELRGRRWLLWIYLIPMYFSGGMITYFVWMRQIHLYDNRLIYILPACYGMWAMIVMKTSFKSIPESMNESAMMDGAGYFRIFRQITLPLSMPMIATMGLFCAVSYWNGWFEGSLLIETQKKWVLQTFLQLAVLKGRASVGINFSTGNSAGGYNIMEWNLSPQEQDKIMKLDSVSIETAYIMVATVPILCVYPFIQKWFVKGVMIGSIKE